MSEIERDPDDPTREYIPIGDWEVQTKGKGSSCRLLHKPTGDRRIILCADANATQEFFTRFVKDMHAIVSKDPTP